MSRAEEKAMDAWAIYEYREHPKGLYHTCFVDGYKQGYEQAEKDLALTWEDVKTLDHLMNDVENANLKACYEGSETPFPDDNAFYGEVLRRFNEKRKEK